MNKFLYWLNILIFPVILFKLLDIFTDVHIFSNIASHMILIGFVLLVYFFLVFLVHFSQKYQNDPSKKHLYRSPYYAVVGIILLFIIVNIIIIFRGGDLGLGYASFLVVNLIIIIGVVISVMVLKIMITFSVPSTQDKKKKYNPLLFTAVFSIILTSLFFLEQTNLEFCKKDICRYEYYYNHPEESINGKHYIWLRIVGTAIYFSDTNFCDNIMESNVEDFDRILVNGQILTAEQQRDRCKQWVSYYKNRDIPERSQGYPPWAFDYPPVDR